MTKILNVLESFTQKYSRKIHASRIAKETNTPQKTTSRILNNLVEKGILKYQRVGKNKEYYLSLNDPLSKNTLLMVEINKSIKFLIKYPKISLLIKELIDKTPVLIFGSYARLAAIKDSDLDILIMRRSKTIKNILTISPYRIRHQYSTFKEFEKLLSKNNALAEEILKNHIIFNYFEKFTDLFMKNG